jgi:hypothetical protein
MKFLINIKTCTILDQMKSEHLREENYIQLIIKYMSTEEMAESSEQNS